MRNENPLAELADTGHLFHFAEEAGADEGIEAEIDLVAACVGIDGRFGFGLLE